MLINHLKKPDNFNSLYEGFDDLCSNQEYGTYSNEATQQVNSKLTSHGRKPQTPLLGRNIITPSKPPVTATLIKLQNTDNSRPMTSVKAAGYSSSGRRQSFGTSRNGDFSSHHATNNKIENDSIEKIKTMEIKVGKLVEDSCILASKGDYVSALEKAKEAGQKERVLVRQKEHLAIKDELNLDLTYSVLLNLANRYTENQMYQEALNTYQAIVKNELFSAVGHLKVNMGNIYFAQKNYPKAIKFYRMALDKVPNEKNSVRIKIMQNIGVSFVKLKQYDDAISSFEHIMQDECNMKTGFYLILCYILTNNRRKMKNAFQNLLKVKLNLDNEDRYLPHHDDKQYDLILEVICNDELRNYEKKKIERMEHFIKLAAKLIAPLIDSSFHAGYDWCIEQVKSSSFQDISYNLEIDKALMFLKKKNFKQAIDTLKSFEKKDTRNACTAATNLSFLYFLERDLAQAERYVDQALSADRYNPSALVNKGNILFVQDNLERARDYYVEALQDDSSCLEALYNLGLVCKKMELYDEALDHFMKLHAIVKNDPSVVYQIMDIYEITGNASLTQEWALQLHGLIPTDPFLLQRFGDQFEREGDKSQAFSYYYDSFKYYPCNFDVIEWLGAYYIEAQFYEKAVSYFERASLMQPNQVKWHLMIAFCHRRSGNYQQALETYKSVHQKFPENVECLQFLIRLSADMGLPEADDYMAKLTRVEKLKDARKQQQQLHNSGRRTSYTTGSRDDLTKINRETCSSSGRETGAPSESKQGQLTARKDSYKLNTEMENLSSVTGSIGTGSTTINYVDPLGPFKERPRTAARSKTTAPDDFADEDIDDNLLPE